MKNKEFYNNYIKYFLQENSKVNLISKNDENYLWEKHIYDSLAIEQFLKKYGFPQTMLDIGTGGGFPAVPIALTYPEIEVVAVDSIAKKIRAIESLKESLNIQNLRTICSRVENIDSEFDLVTARAVASLNKICSFALPKVKKGGYFLAFKSKKYKEEIDESKSVLKKYHAEIIDIIEYKLPIEEEHTRNLLVIKR